MNKTDYSVDNEGAILDSYGIAYYHIPVPFESPALEHFQQFYQVFHSAQNKKTLVHCAANMRVSTFVALYRVKRQHYSTSDAWDHIRTIWEPNPVWTAFIKQVLSNH